MLSTLFNTGMRQVENQVNVLEEGTNDLMVALDMAKGNVDKAVEQLVLIRQAQQLVNDNVRWIELELSHSKHTLNYVETKQLYERYDSNHDEQRVLRSMHIDYEPIAASGVRVVANEFQEVLDNYDDEIDILAELIEEHGSDSNKDQLKEVLSKYGIIYGSQVTKFNTYINEYGFDDLVR